jgi:GNAT superfamily N-acetyltransferase
MAATAHAFSSTDRVLAARLEAAEAENMIALTQALAVTQPDAEFEAFAGGVAIFAGVGSPMTHAVGIGMQRAVPEGELERMEGFFRDRKSACLVDLCPLVDASVLAFFYGRPYRVSEFNNVLARRITPDEEIPTDARVRPVQPNEREDFSRLVLRGFSENLPLSEEMVQTLSATMGPSRSWVAGDSQPEAGAAMGIRSGVALFYGDATLPTSRGKGWQLKLIQSRLLTAQREGCDLAMVSVLPGSGSHRNYERAGFQLIYMRVNLIREF